MILSISILFLYFFQELIRVRKMKKEVCFFRPEYKLVFVFSIESIIFLATKLFTYEKKDSSDYGKFWVIRNRNSKTIFRATYPFNTKQDWCNLSKLLVWRLRDLSASPTFRIGKYCTPNFTYHEKNYQYQYEYKSVFYKSKKHLWLCDRITPRNTPE